MIRVSLKSNPIPITRSNDQRNRMLVSPRGVETNYHKLIKGFHYGFFKGFHQGLIIRGSIRSCIRGSSRVLLGILLRVSSWVLPGLSNSDQRIARVLPDLCDYGTRRQGDIIRETSKWDANKAPRISQSLLNSGVY